MSARSPVRTIALCRRAVVTTPASTTSAVLVKPSSRPASCASRSPKGTIRAPGQESPQLGLSWRAANLGDHQCGNKRNHAKFQTRLMFRPHPPIVSVRSYEDGGVVNDGTHAGRRPFGDARICACTLRRASVISSALRCPCCFSHRATAAKPARRCRASRAALVIQADTLTLSFATCSFRTPRLVRAQNQHRLKFAFTQRSRYQRRILSNS